jgi:hypothetical protein
MAAAHFDTAKWSAYALRVSAPITWDVTLDVPLNNAGGTLPTELRMRIPETPEQLDAAAEKMRELVQKVMKMRKARNPDDITGIEWVCAKIFKNMCAQSGVRVFDWPSSTPRAFALGSIQAPIQATEGCILAPDVALFDVLVPQIRRVADERIEWLIGHNYDYILVDCVHNDSTRVNPHARRNHWTFHIMTANRQLADMREDGIQEIL